MSKPTLLNEYKYEVLEGISVSGSRAAIAQVKHIMNLYAKLADDNAELKKALAAIMEVTANNFDHDMHRIWKLANAAQET